MSMELGWSVAQVMRLGMRSVMAAGSSSLSLPLEDKLGESLPSSMVKNEGAMGSVTALANSY